MPTLCYAASTFGEAVLQFYAAMQPRFVQPCFLFMVPYKMASAAYLLSSAYLFKSCVHRREAALVSAQWLAALLLLLVGTLVDEWFR